MAETEKCQKCKTAFANVNVTYVENGKKKHWKLCEACAQKHDELQQLSAAPEFFKKFVQNIFGADMEDKIKLQCPNCNLTLQEFENSGLLGCEDCYSTFQDELNILLKRIHGSHKHIGSRPRPARAIGDVPDLEAVKINLREAIEQKNYELAAEYRDKIRDFEREIQHQNHTNGQDR
jgi:protein arginine kinase activator